MHIIGRLLATGLILIAVSYARPVTAQERSVDDSVTDPDVFFVLGNLEYILLHELAHVLIGDLDIPIVGPEEGAADYIAAAILIRAEEFDARRADRARQFLLATATGLATSWDFVAESGAEVHYWDSHALTIQRFYQIICLIYGSNHEAFAALPSRVGMPEPRASRCPAEFARAERGLRWLLENYGRMEGDPTGAEISVRFERAPTLVSQRVADGIVASGMLDNIIVRLRERFTVTMPFGVVFRRCGQAQAAWLPPDRELVVCYELLDAYYALGRTSSSDRRRQQLGAP